MFKDHEKLSIENTKQEIKSLIRTRNLLYGLYGNNVVIAGGFFTNVLQNSKFKDIDIFILGNDVGLYNHLTEGFKKQSDAQKEKEQVMRGELLPVTPLDSMFDDVVQEAEWSRSEMMAYMHNTNIVDVINNHRTQAQYILTKYQTREELLEHFDYKHCKVSYDPLVDKLYITREIYDCIQKKILKVNNDQNSKNHQYRLNNFLNKGWVLETTVEQSLTPLTTDQIKDSYEKLKEKAIAAALGLPPMSYTISKQDLDNAGITAQTVEELLNPVK